MPCTIGLYLIVLDAVIHNYEHQFHHGNGMNEERRSLPRRGQPTPAALMDANGLRQPRNKISTGGERTCETDAATARTTMDVPPPPPVQTPNPHVEELFSARI
jgi:hypothetical protein